MFNGVKKVIQLITESDILIYSKTPDTLTQSCTWVQISRSDPAHENRDPTRWLSMMGKKGFMHGTMHTVQRLHPCDQQHAKVLPRFGLTRYMFLQYECIAICTKSPLYIRCFQIHWTVMTECRLTCTLETSVMWLSSYLLWFIHGLAIKSRYVKQQLLELYEYS